MQYIIIFILLVIFLGVMYVTSKSISAWRLVKASELSISYIEFLFQYAEMLVRSIPADMVFKLLANAKKGGAFISLHILKDFYKLVDRTVFITVQDFNKNLLEGELRLRRISSYYVISGSIDELLELIQDSLSAEKELTVKGSMKRSAEMLKMTTVNALLKKYSDSLFTSLSKHIPQQQENDGKKEDIATVTANNSAVINSILKHYTIELRTSLKTMRVYFSKGENLKILKRHIFENTAASLIKAQQSGLNIGMRELEVYFGMNGNIEQTIEILLKARHLGFEIELKHLEKFTVTGGDIENTLLNLINAKKAGLKIELNDLEKYHLLGGDIETVVKALIRAHHEGLTVSITHLSEYLSQGGDVDEIVGALIKLHQEKIDIKLSELSEYKAAGGDVKQVVLDIIKAYQSGLIIPMKKLKSFLAQGGDVKKLINVMIKAGRADLDITFDDCEKLARIDVDINTLFETLKVEKRANLSIPKEKFMDLQNAGGDMLAYIRTLDVSERLGLGINPEELEADLVEGRQVMNVLYAIMQAKQEGVKLDYNKGIRLDRAGHDIYEVVKWAVHPQIIKIEPITVVTKDGYEIKLWVNVMIRGRVEQYFRGSREEVLRDRVNEAVIKEIELKSSYRDVLESLSEIAEKLFKRLTVRMTAEEFPELDADEIALSNEKETKLNAGSAFEILDINIPNIEMGKDALAQIKKEMADLEKALAKTDSDKRKAKAIAQELEAKAKLVEAEAELQRGMAHAFKEGKMDTKEYHKKKIFDDEELLTYVEKKKHGEQEQEDDH
jgi:uncharacterized protein YqfA (UPF0365 family)